MKRPDELLALFADDNPAIWPLHWGVAILSGLDLAAGTKTVWRRLT